MLQKGIKINYLCTITNGFGVEFLLNDVAVAISIEVVKFSAFASVFVCSVYKVYKFCN